MPPCLRTFCCELCHGKPPPALMCWTLAGMARRSSLQNGAEAGLLAKALPEPPAPDIARSIAGACEKNRLFAMISTKMREDMAKNFRAVDLAGGDTLTTEGQDGCTFFVLESGRCSIEVEGTLVGALAPWQSAGELEIICKQPRRATIKATETSRVWCLGQEHVTEVCPCRTPTLTTSPRHTDSAFVCHRSNPSKARTCGHS